MFHKIKNVTALPDYMLSVQFSEGVTKVYDVNPLFNKWSAFSEIKDKEIFSSVYVDDGGYGIVWNPRVDLSCSELWENGKTIKTMFED